MVLERAVSLLLSHGGWPEQKRGIVDVALGYCRIAPVPYCTRLFAPSKDSIRRHKLPMVVYQRPGSPLMITILGI